MIKQRLRRNADHFPGEEDRIYYIYSQTSGTAQKTLLPRYKSSSRDPFLSAEEIIAELRGVFKDPFKQDNCRDAYQDLHMDEFPNFHLFITRFRELAQKGVINKSEWTADLRRKITNDLRNSTKHLTNSKLPFAEYCHELTFYDADRQQ